MDNQELFIPLDVTEYKTRFKDQGESHLLLDVRTLEEYEEVRIPDAINIPLDELEDRVAEVPVDKPIVLVCRSGMRSMMGAEVLRHLGLRDATLYNLDGGTKAWVSKGWQTDSGEAE
jgi:rhodanese-related sulfurtransferase